MDFSFSPEQDMLRSSVRDLLSATLPLDRVAALADSDDGWDPSSWARLVDLGLVGMAVPEDLGGTGLTFLEESVAFEEMGRGLYPGPFFSTVGLALPLLLAGAQALPEAMQPVLRGRSTATVAFAEAPGAASLADTAGMTCVARQEAGQWRLTGTKSFVTDLAVVDEAIVVAASEWGCGAWIVDLRAHREAVRPLSTMDRTRRLGELVLDGTPATLLLGPGEGAVTALTALRSRALAALACEAVGITQRALEVSRDYVSQRQQFDRPIGTYQAISHRVANMYVGLELSRSLAYWSAWCVSVDDPGRELAAAAAKAAASEAAVAACEGAIQVMGGMGFTWEQPLHRLYKRAQAIEAFDGHPRAQRARIAGQLLAGGS